MKSSLEMLGVFHILHCYKYWCDVQTFERGLKSDSVSVKYEKYPKFFSYSEGRVHLKGWAIPYFTQLLPIGWQIISSFMNMNAVM